MALLAAPAALADGRDSDRFGSGGRGSQQSYCPPPRSTRVIDPREDRRYRHRHEPIRYERCEDGCDRRLFGVNAAAWDELGEGCYLSARRRFDNLIDYHPYEPVPYVGYAIASGILGHHGDAEWAMRQAVEFDADALDAVETGCGGLEREIRGLTDEYVDRIECGACSARDYFMLAALQTILGCYEEAHGSIERAIDSGDCSESARLLRCEIESHLPKCNVNRDDDDDRYSHSRRFDEPRRHRYDDHRRYD